MHGCLLSTSLVTCRLLFGGAAGWGKGSSACTVTVQTSSMLPTTSLVRVQEPADNDIKESSCASGSQAFLTVTSHFEQTQQSITKLQSEL